MHSKNLPLLQIREAQKNSFLLAGYVPEDIHRDNLFPVLESVSNHSGAIILKVQDSIGGKKRLVVVFGDSHEDLFRLTSRQFYVSPGKLVNFVEVPSNSTLWAYCHKIKYLQLKLTFHIPKDSDVMAKEIINYVRKFGNISVKSFTSKNGENEWTLSAGIDFSLFKISSNLQFRYKAVEVYVEYLEELLCKEYIVSGLEDLSPKVTPQSSTKKMISEKAAFFPHNSSKKVCEAEPSTSTGALEAFDDNLSAYSEDSDLEEFEEGKGSEYFIQLNSRLFLESASTPFGLNPATRETAIICRLVEAKKEDEVTADKDQIASNCRLATQVQEPSQSEEPAKKKRKRKNKKNSKLSAKDELPSEEWIPIETGAKEIPEVDGFSLLEGLVDCPREELAKINELCMPLIQAKWKKFVEIKDSILKEKHLKRTQKGGLQI